MNLASTALLALAMSTDAFAAAVGKRSALQKPRWREALRTAGLKVSEQDNSPKPSRHSFWLLAMTGFATSIDAMAVGVGLAFLDVNIVPVAAAIGLTAFLMVTAGVMLGRVLGACLALHRIDRDQYFVETAP